MTITVVGLAGVPAAGKSTLMLEIINRLSGGKPGRGIKLGLTKALAFDSGKGVVLGVYDGTLFQGTDRLSMAVQPDAVKLLAKLQGSPEYDGWQVFFEGDRLFNSKLIGSLRDLNIPYRLYMLEASPEVLALRYAERNNVQTEKWIASRETKCKNLLAAHPEIVRLKSETAQERTANLETVLGLRVAA